MNYFSLLGLPEQYSLDRQKLTDRYHQCMQSAHPDNFINEPDLIRRRAMEKTTTLNDAFGQLKNGLPRALYWMNLKGESKCPESTLTLTQEMMEAQINTREKIAFGTSEERKALLEQLTQQRQEFENRFAEISQEPATLTSQGWSIIGQWQFCEKLISLTQEKGVDQ